MRLVIALCVLVVLPAAAAANGFGLFRRPAPAQSCPSYYYAPVESPYYYSVVPVPAYPIPMQTVPLVPVAPVPMPLPLRGQPVPVMPLAPPEVAPPSTAPVLRPAAANPMSYADERNTSAKLMTTAFDIYTSADVQPAPVPGRFLIRFWNLSSVPLTLNVDGRRVEVPTGQSRTVETGEEFTWQVAGRASEVSRVPVDARGVTVAIRR